MVASSAQDKVPNVEQALADERGSMEAVTEDDEISKISLSACPSLEPRDVTEFSREITAYQPPFVMTSMFAFRKLILTISEQLTHEDVVNCAFIENVPPEEASSTLCLMGYLIEVGAFSHSNVEPLKILMQSINRYDLAHLVKTEYGE